MGSHVLGIGLTRGANVSDAVGVNPADARVSGRAAATRLVHRA
jgi:hypothetical protein